MLEQNCTPIARFATAVDCKRLRSHPTIDDVLDTSSRPATHYSPRVNSTIVERKFGRGSDGMWPIPLPRSVGRGLVSGPDRSAPSWAVASPSPRGAAARASGSPSPARASRPSRRASHGHRESSLMSRFDAAATGDDCESLCRHNRRTCTESIGVTPSCTITTSELTRRCDHADDRSQSAPLPLPADFHLRKTSGELVCDAGGVVGRAVVDDENRELRRQVAGQLQHLLDASATAAIHYCRPAVRSLAICSTRRLLWLAIGAVPGVPGGGSRHVLSNGSENLSAESGELPPPQGLRRPCHPHRSSESQQARSVSAAVGRPPVVDIRRRTTGSARRVDGWRSVRPTGMLTQS